jgi:hypothetical protein
MYGTELPTLLRDVRLEIEEAADGIYFPILCRDHEGSTPIVEVGVDGTELVLE